MDTALLFTLFFVLLLLGVPIVFTLGVSSLAFIILSPIPLSIVPQKMVVSLESFIYLALPLFILTGEVMNSGGITQRLINLSKIFVSGLRGGLAYVNVIVSMLFGGVQGMATADTAAIGQVLIPGMHKAGYNLAFSAALTVASSTIGALIPPSLLFIIYGAVGGVSVGALFLGGVIPGFLIGFCQMGLIYFMVRRDRSAKRFPQGEKLSRATTWQYLREGGPTMMIPVIIIGGITSGVFTPTESAGIAVIVALVLALAYREMKVSDLPGVLLRAGKLSGSLMLIVSTAAVFAFILTAERVPHEVGEVLNTLTSNKILLLLIINVFLLVVGTFMDPTPSVIILAPILAPIMIGMGLDEIHVAIIICFNLILGLTTPPVGVCLFIASTVGKVSIERISWAMMPFLILNIGVLLLVTFVPETVTFLPRLAGY